MSADYRLHRSAATEDAARTPRKRTRRQPEPVTVTQVLPLVWNHARALACGDLGRLRVLDEFTVMITNGSQ
jgi:hypothetical protein